MRAVDVVVARYNEDVSWLASRLPPDTTTTNVIVYDKGGDNNAAMIRLPNVGREAHTYAYHIVTKYDDLADFTWFVQGRVDDHDRRAADIIAAFPAPTQSFVPLGANGPWGPHGLRVVDLDCGKHPNLRPVTERMFRTLFGQDARPPDAYNFMPGALFGASRDAIRARGLDFWKRLLAMLEHDVNPLEAYAAERLWPLFFQAWEQR